MTCLESSLNQNPRERLWDREGKEDGLGSSDFGAFHSEWAQGQGGAVVQAEADLKCLVFLGTVSLVSLNLVSLVSSL